LLYKNAKSFYCFTVSQPASPQHLLPIQFSAGKYQTEGR